MDTVWRSPETGMLDVICRLFNEEGKKRKLFVAGHSLGGALATIATTSLAFYKGLDVTALYTFGSPRYSSAVHASSGRVCVQTCMRCLGTRLGAQ